jgi:hypothetical protein
MAGLTVHFEVLNQLNSPALYAATLANRPAAQLVGRIFFRTDAPYGIYRDTGTAWVLIASPDTTGITGTLAAGQVPYATGASTIAGTNNLFFDSTNNRLGINTASPGAPLDVHGTGTQMQLNGTGTNNSFLVFQNAGVSKWRLGNNYSAGTNYFSLFDSTNSSEIVKIQAGTTGSNGILTNTASVRNNYTEIGIAAATSVDGFATSNSYTFNAGITRTIGTVGNQIGSTFTYSGTYIQDVTGDWGNLSAPFTLVMNGNITNNQTGTYIKSPSSGRFGLTPSGTGTISHFATLNSLPDFGGNTLTVTNRYGVLINNFAGFTNNPTYTNRWGIYQDGSSDNNYFAGKLLIGTTTVGTEILKVNGTSLLTGFATISGSSTAASLIARGALISSTLVAAANNDVLIGLDISPTFTNGAFTGVANYAARFNGAFGSNSNLSISRNLSSNTALGVIFADNSETSIINTTSTATIRFTLGAVNYGRFLGTTGNFAIQNGGTYTDIASARLAVNSTTQGFLPPRMTTSEKNAIATPAQGLIVFDTTLIKLCVYSGTAWETITSI